MFQKCIRDRQLEHTSSKRDNVVLMTGHPILSLLMQRVCRTLPLWNPKTKPFTRSKPLHPQSATKSKCNNSEESLSLQEKWLTVGSRYKNDYNVSFPPFEFLLDFVYQQSKRRNDPSFFLTTEQEESRKSIRQLNKPAFPKAFTTHKIQVSPTIHRLQGNPKTRQIQQTVLPTQHASSLVQM